MRKGLFGQMIIQSKVSYQILNTKYIKQFQSIIQKIQSNQRILEAVTNLFGYEKYNKRKCAVVEFSYSEKKDGNIDAIFKKWIDLRTGVALKEEIEQFSIYDLNGEKILENPTQKITYYKEIQLNKVKNKDVAKPSLEGYTEITDNIETEEVRKLNKGERCSPRQERLQNFIQNFTQIS